MSKALKIRLLRYGISVVSGLAVGIAYLIGQDFLEQGLMDRYRLLSDAFFLPGILMVLFGCLLWMSNEGAFDGVGYVVSNAFYWLIPGGRLHHYERYGDYVERKRSKRVTGYSFLFWVGVVFVAVGFVFNLLFEHLHG